jgi:hypothetical protein
VRANWPEIHQFYKSGSVSSAGGVLSFSASSFNKEFELKELQTFFDEKLLELGSGKVSVESALQKTQANIVWMKKHYTEIVNWLEAKNEVVRKQI